MNLDPLYALAFAASIVPPLPVTKELEKKFDRLSQVNKKTAFINKEIFTIKDLTTHDRRIWARKIHDLGNELAQQALWSEACTTYSAAIKLLLQEKAYPLSEDDNCNILSSFEAALKVREKKTIDKRIVHHVQKHWDTIDQNIKSQYPAVARFFNCEKAISSKSPSPEGSCSEISLKNSIKEQIALFHQYLLTDNMTLCVETAEVIGDSYFDSGVENHKASHLQKAELYYNFVKKHQTTSREDIDISILHALEKQYILTKDTAVRNKMIEYIQELQQKGFAHSDFNYFINFLAQ